MKILKSFLLLCLIAVIVTTFLGCGKDDSGLESSSGDLVEKPSNVSKPTIKEVVSAATTTDFDATFRINSQEEPSRVTFHYVTYSKKASGVSASSCNKSSSCVFQQVEGKSSKYWYYRVRHTGFKQGYYIYYYVEATNSAGTTKTSVSSKVFKRS